MKRVHVRDLFVAHLWNGGNAITEVPACITASELDRILAGSMDAFTNPADKLVSDLEEEAARVGFHNIRLESFDA